MSACRACGGVEIRGDQADQLGAVRFVELVRSGGFDETTSDARHGGPDSRQLPDSQSAEEVAAVIVNVIVSRHPDVYTRPGAHDRVVKYYETIAVDPQT